MPTYAAFFERDAAMYVDLDFQEWFARMQAVSEAGERQLFHMDPLL